MKLHLILKSLSLTVIKVQIEQHLVDESKDCVNCPVVCGKCFEDASQDSSKEQTLRKLVWPCLWPRQAKAHQKWDRLVGVLLEGRRQIIQLKVSPPKKKRKKKNDV